METYRAVGKPMPLLDGRAKVTGSLRFVGSLNLPGTLHAKLVTSPYAHANIRSIDTEAALALPGVAAVFTAQDLPNIAPSGRTRLLLARDRVIFVGQPVAIILATSEAAAEDALDYVQVDYEPLPAAITMDEATAPDAPLVWHNGVPSGNDDAAMHGAASSVDERASEKFSNIAHETTNDRGDIAQGFAEADVVVERSFISSVVHQSYIEPQSVLAQPDLINDGITIWSSTQGQFPVREDVADVLGIPEVNVRVIGAPVGGGFGGKIVLYEPLIALVARKIGHPVKLILTRMEDMIAGNPAPAVSVWLKVGAKNDGTLTALHAKIKVDCGCYATGWLDGAIASLLGSLYRLPHFRIESSEILTFKVSVGSYRAPGAPTGDFALETVMDELARTVEIDPFEFRFKNASRNGDLKSDGKPWPTMGMHEVLETLQAHPVWQERETARAQGHGLGIAVGGWMGGVEPTAAGCMVDRDGIVNIHIGSTDLSGTATSFALMAAEVMGVPIEQVRVNLADTANAPYAGVSAGSKTTYTVGPAVIKAAEEARQQLLTIAADEFEADPADLEIIEGKIQVRGVPNRTLSLSDVVAQGMAWNSKYGPIIAHARHADPEQAPGFCAQLAEVEVDQETGEVHVHRLVIVQDVGRAINPLAVEGQLLGGATQGLGWALYEGIVYSDDGQVLTGSWMDYAVPATTQAAKKYDAIIIEVPTEHGPFGARGVGEPPVIPTAAAVANAIADATGARLTDLPMTPPRVLSALENIGDPVPSNTTG